MKEQGRDDQVGSFHVNSSAFLSLHTKCMSTSNTLLVILNISQYKQSTQPNRLTKAKW